MPPSRPSQERSWLRSRGGLVFLAFLALASVFLIMEHRAHVFSVSPSVLFLLCPVLRLLMHGRQSDTHMQYEMRPLQRPQGDA